MTSSANGPALLSGQRAPGLSIPGPQVVKLRPAASPSKQQPDAPPRVLRGHEELAVGWTWHRDGQARPVRAVPPPHVVVIRADLCGLAETTDDHHAIRSLLQKAGTASSGCAARWMELLPVCAVEGPGAIEGRPSRSRAAAYVQSPKQNQPVTVVGQSGAASTWWCWLRKP